MRMHRRRKLQFLDLSAAFGEFRSDFGLPPSLSSLIALTELRIKVPVPLVVQAPAAGACCGTASAHHVFNLNLRSPWSTAHGVTSLNWQVNNMTAASMAAVAHLRALQSFRLQAGGST